HEQPDRVLLAPFAIAVRVSDRSGLPRDGAGNVLAAEARRGADGDHPEYAGSRGIMGFGPAGRGGATASSPGSDRRLSTLAVRRRRQSGAGAIVSAFGARQAPPV